MEQATCKNCHAVLIDAYCHKCGQKASTSRITLKSLWHEILHSLTHIEKGFFYTSLELIIHPGRVINGYLTGKRINLHKPFSLFFIWGTIYLLVDNIIRKEIGYVPTADLSPGSLLYEPLKAVYPYYEHYLAIITLPLMLIAPIFSYHLFFKKRNYNYIELVIIMVYISTIAYMINIVVQFVSAITGVYAIVQNNQLMIIIPSIIQIWVLYDVIKQKPYWKSFIISIVLMFIAFLLLYSYLRFAVPFVVSLFM